MVVDLFGVLFMKSEAAVPLFSFQQAKSIPTRIPIGESDAPFSLLTVFVVDLIRSMISITSE